MVDTVSCIIKPNEKIYTILENLKQIGFKSYDALHLTCAETAEVDILLSTDGKLIRKAAHCNSILTIKVDNPLTWLQKVL